MRQSPESACQAGAHMWEPVCAHCPPSRCVRGPAAQAVLVLSSPHCLSLWPEGEGVSNPAGAGGWPCLPGASIYRMGEGQGRIRWQPHMQSCAPPSNCGQKGMQLGCARAHRPLPLPSGAKTKAAFVAGSHTWPRGWPACPVRGHDTDYFMGGAHPARRGGVRQQARRQAGPAPKPRVPTPHPRPRNPGSHQAVSAPLL